MSRFYQPLPFSTAYDFVAAKPVTLNGAVLNPGDPVDKDGLSPRRLRQLYEARIISPVAPAELPATPAPQEPAQEPAQEPVAAAQAPAEPEGEATPDDGEQAPQEAATTAGGARVEHRGFGRYFVIAADGSETGPMSKAEAQAALEA